MENPQKDSEPDLCVCVCVASPHTAGQPGTATLHKEDKLGGQSFPYHITRIAFSNPPCVLHFTLPLNYCSFPRI